MLFDKMFFFGDVGLICYLRVGCVLVCLYALVFSDDVLL